MEHLQIMACFAKMPQMATKLTLEEAARIGSHVKAARVYSGRTLQETASLSGVTYTQLSRIERGVFKTYSRNVQKICTFLRIPDSGKITNAGLQVDIAGRAARVALQSSKNQRVLEAVLTALDERAVPTSESPIQ